MGKLDSCLSSTIQFSGHHQSDPKQRARSSPWSQVLAPKQNKTAHQSKFPELKNQSNIKEGEGVKRSDEKEEGVEGSMRRK